MRMLRWTCGKTLLDMIPNGAFRKNLQVATIINKMREGRLRWFAHVKRRPQSAPVRRVETIVVDGVRRRGRPKLRWEYTLKTDLKELMLSEDMTSDRNSWRTRIMVDELYVGMLVLYMPSLSSPLMWSFWVHALLPEVFLEAVPLSLDRGVTVYIPPPPYLALVGLGMVVVVVVVHERELRVRLSLETTSSVKLVSVYPVKLEVASSVDEEAASSVDKEAASSVYEEAVSLMVLQQLYNVLEFVF
ncbi:hypothetical protein Tco_0619836 [Tanacetum coccineum]